MNTGSDAAKHVRLAALSTTAAPLSKEQTPTHTHTHTHRHSKRESDLSQRAKFLFMLEQ